MNRTSSPTSYGSSSPPTQFHFLKVLFEGVVASARVFTEMLKAPDAPSNNASSG
ncbi:hypothetical protein O1428_01200 [Bacteroides fragilis]|nr:hypothetical protein [Prevotella histicola]MCZ2596784.1 hypothetical protein [Bacteroides fragilis]